MTTKQSFLNKLRSDSTFSTYRTKSVHVFKPENNTEQKNIYFLVDGSASMTAGSYNNKETALEIALSTCYLLTSGSSYKDYSTIVSTTLFGNNSKTPPTITSKEGLNIVQDFFDAAEDGLHCGTDLINEIDAVSDIMADQGGEQNAELVILTDGDLFKIKDTTEKLVTLQELYPNININIYKLRNQYNSKIEEIIPALSDVNIHVNYKSISSTDELLTEMVDKISPKMAEELRVGDLSETLDSLSKDFDEVSKKLETMKTKIQKLSQPRRKFGQ